MRGQHFFFEVLRDLSHEGLQGVFAGFKLHLLEGGILLCGIFSLKGFFEVAHAVQEHVDLLAQVLAKFAVRFVLLWLGLHLRE